MLQFERSNVQQQQQPQQQQQQQQQEERLLALSAVLTVVETGRPLQLAMVNVFYQFQGDIGQLFRSDKPQTLTHRSYELECMCSFCPQHGHGVCWMPTCRRIERTHTTPTSVVSCTHEYLVSYFVDCLCLPTPSKDDATILAYIERIWRHIHTVRKKDVNLL